MAGARRSLPGSGGKAQAQKTTSARGKRERPPMTREMALDELGLQGDDFDATKLGQLKAQATKDYDIKKLEAIDLLVAELSTRNVDVGKKKEELENAVREAVGTLKTDMQAAEDGTLERELEIRERINMQYNYARQTQLAELEAIEKARLAKHRRIGEWVPAAWHQKQDLARRVALGGEHQRAQDIMEEADTERAEQRQARIREVDRETEDVINNKLQRYEEVLRGIQGRLEQALIENTEAYELAITKAKRRAGVSIDCARKAAMRGMPARGELLSDRAELVKVLTGHLLQTLKLEEQQLRREGSKLADIVAGFASPAT